MKPFSLLALALSGFWASTTLASDQGYWYTGASVGYGHYSILDDEQFIGGVNLGYRYSPYFATQLDYQYLNTYQDDFGVDQILMSGKLLYPLTPQLEPYLTLGVSRWFGDEYGRSISGFSPVLGAGINYLPVDNLAMGLSYQYVDSLGEREDVGHSGLFFNVSYRFGQDKATYAPLPEARPTEVVPMKETQADNSFESLEPLVVHVLFGVDAAEMKDESKLKAVLETLRATPGLRVKVYGWASEVGAEQYNLILSQKRAKAVADYLISQGIASSRIYYEGMGEYESDTEPMSFGQRADVVVR